MSKLTCFKAYDIGGEIGVNIDKGIAYRIGHAAFKCKIWCHRI